MISAHDFLKGHPEQIHTQDDLESLEQSNGIPHKSYEDISSENTQLHSEDTAAQSLQRLLENDKESGTFRRSDEENKCQEAALRLLDSADRPSAALHDRLIDKGYDEETVQVVIERLINASLINDEAYTQRAVRYCVSRMMGKIGTLNELKRKGVDTSLARREVEAADENGMFIDSAYALVEKTLRRTRGLDKKVRIRRLWSAAGRKGHSPELIRQAQNEFFAQEEETSD